MPDSPRRAGERLRKSLRRSFYDGIAYAVMFGVGDSFLNPFAVALGASPGQIGLLTSLPQLAGSLSQAMATRVTAFLGRKRTVILFVALQGLTWLPILLVPWLLPGRRMLWLIFLATLYAFFGAMPNPAWFSIMTQYIPPGRRGAYFSFRNRWGGGVTVLSGFVAGGVLWLAPASWGAASFSLLFAVALLCRMACVVFLAGQHEPGQHRPAAVADGFTDGQARPLGPNFRRFVLFAAAYSLAAYLVAPFFPVLTLRHLGWDYLSYVTVNTALAATTFLTIVSWGRHADRAGNVAVLRLTGFLVALVPALWLVSTHKAFIFALNVFAGFGWAGYNLAVANFVFDAVPPPQRVRGVAVYTLATGVGVSLGSLAGGLLVPVLPPLNGSSIFTLCAISAVLRLLAWAMLLPGVHEERRVERVRRRDLLLSVAGLRPLPAPGGISEPLRD
jgi:MFS family permease